MTESANPDWKEPFRLIHPEGDVLGEFSGYQPLQTGRDYSFETQEGLVDFSTVLTFENTPLASCHGVLVRTICTAESLLESPKKQLVNMDSENGGRVWVMKVTFHGIEFYLAEDVDLTASIVRPDLVLFFLQRVKKAFL